MKTKVTIQRSKSGSYDHLNVVILQPSKYNPRDLSRIGILSWQGDNTNGWYGLNITVNTDLCDHAHLLAMYKLACYIHERAIDKSPAEVLAIIGADPHVYDYGIHIPISDNGKYVYDVKQPNNSTYTRVIAANEIMAQRIVDGLIKRKEIPDDTYKLVQGHARLAKVCTDLTIPLLATTSQN